MFDRPHDTHGHLWSLRGNGGYLATVHALRVQIG